jgi:DNA-binding winged helix-turn-helix (wHTH) protein/tetratricopeptide (TPR) repeat protein/TolB-like protein
VLRFAGYELDPQRAELRGPDGEAIRLRPKSFDMLQVFAANSGRVLSKQELLEAVWPNVHVGEDSLFQCIREIRTVLGDDRRQLIRLVSGRGYLLDAEVSGAPADTQGSGEPIGVAAVPAAEPATESASGIPSAADPEAKAEPARTRHRFVLSGPAAFAAVAAIGTIVGLAAATPIFAPDLIFAGRPPTIAVMPIAGTNPRVAEMAVNVTDRLTDGLAKIDKIRVLAPQPRVASASPAVARSAPADFVLSGELQKTAQSWDVQARLTDTATGEVRWTTSLSVDVEDGDVSLQQSRLAAGIGHPLALRINALSNSGKRSARTDNGSPSGNAKVVIEQATASINQTSPERFKAAQTMLEKALAVDPDNVDLEVALAANLLRGIQMVWYSPADAAAAESRALSMLERALQAEPGYIPPLESYCRFLAATNHFVESLIACARTLSFDPWDGIALYHIGLAQLQLGRFEDALATFKQADQFNTPRVARWTWLLGAGLTYAVMGRNDEAVTWLQRSIAITPATGRTHLVLAAVYQQLGRLDEAKAAIAKGMELRPGSTAANISLPAKNASPIYLAASERICRAAVEAGLPER